MDAFVDLAISVFPEIRNFVSDNIADPTTAKVIKAVKETTGTATPEEAKVKVTGPSQEMVLLKLQLQLAQIALDAGAASDELDLANTQSARKMIVDLANTNEVQWSTPALISYVVVLGFVALVFMIVAGHAPGVQGFHKPDGSWDKPNDTLAQLANICIGALAASFATVLNFWLGSSLGSRRKDVQAVQASSVEQVRNAVQ